MSISLPGGMDKKFWIQILKHGISNCAVGNKFCLTVRINSLVQMHASDFQVSHSCHPSHDKR